MKIIAYKPDIGQEYSNPFKDNNIYPFNKIGRVACDKNTAEIKFWLNEQNSNLDSNGHPINWENLDIYTYIPKFYAKREWVGDTLKDTILSEIPEEINRAGYEIHPAFIKPDGSVRDYILIGCFKGVEIGGQLRSVPNGQKPLVSQTIANLMSKARQGRSNNFSVENPQALTAMQFLYKVAFGTLNAQSAIGNGWTGKSESAPVGTTMSLGNRSGYTGVNGNQISVFGVEDWYGNIWSFVTGIYAKDDGYRITNDPSKFGGSSADYDLVSIPVLMGTENNKEVSGYVKKISKIEGTHKYWNIPSELGGGTTTYYCDYFWSHKKTQENICVFGASWVGGAAAGAFCLDLRTVASHSWGSFGARLCYLP